MKIKPLCHELIAKLEIAVAHRNRERAMAVIERHFEELDEPRPKGLDTPLADILPMAQASLLAKQGYLFVSDLAGVSEADLAEIKGIGKQLIAGLREKLNHRLHSESG